MMNLEVLEAAARGWHGMRPNELQHFYGEHFAASLTGARLRFTNGAPLIAIRAGSLLRGLYRARFGGRIPTISTRGGVVSIRYPRVLDRGWLNCGSQCPSEVELNARIPWGIEVRGGASRLVTDLSELRLGSLSLEGGASRVEVALPAPSGAVAVVILGGASNVVVRRPNGVSARLRVGGGATHLTFDDRRIGAAGGELDLRNRDYDGASDRYDITITGGANNVSVDKQRGVRLEGAEPNPRSPNTEGVDLDREG